jgi:hypothetical protein
MDAYDIYHKIKQLWSDNVDKASGTINKPSGIIKVCVWTEDGYREVIGASYNSKLKIIELEMDQE